VGGHNLSLVWNAELLQYFGGTLHVFPVGYTAHYYAYERFFHKKIISVKFSEFKKEVSGLKKLSEGWRGVVYTGVWKGQKVSLKVAKSEELIKAIQKEADILERLKGLKGFPQLLLKGEDFFLYRYIEGVPFRKAELSPEEERRVWRRLLELAYLLDELGISRDEFAHLDKNVLIGEGGEVYVLDFERGKFSERPTNVTQFIQFLRRKGLLSMEEAIELGRGYGKKRREVFDKLMAKLK
jgi:putative serine/threonine protein kinase